LPLPRIAAGVPGTRSQRQNTPESIRGRGGKEFRVVFYLHLKKIKTLQTETELQGFFFFAARQLVNTSILHSSYDPSFSFKNYLAMKDFQTVSAH